MSVLPFVRICLRPVNMQVCCPAAFLVKFSQLNFSTSSSSPVGAEGKQFKRPITPYLRFQNDFLAKLKEENPHLKHPEIRKLLSEEWANLEPDIKDDYKRRYAQRMEEFKAPFKKMPRKPPNIFSLFVRENFAKMQSENTDMKNPGIIQALGAQWKGLAEYEKALYRTKVEEETRQYESDVVEFEGKLTKEERAILNQLAKEKMKKLHQKRLKLLNFPKKPGSSFILFVNMEKDNFHRGDEESMQEWIRRMGEKWRSMSDDEKEMYKFVRKGALEKYHDDVVIWENEQHNKL